MAQANARTVRKWLKTNKKELSTFLDIKFSGWFDESWKISYKVSYPQLTPQQRELSDKLTDMLRDMK